MARLRVSGDGAVARLVLARPPVNAVDGRLLDELAAALADPPPARVLVLSGEGRCFSAGHDRNEDAVLDDPGAAADRFRQAHACIAALIGLPTPTIASVHGAAVGVGLLLAASCSVAVFSDDALLQLPERSVGMVAGVAHARRLLPPAVARWLALTGRPLRAGELRGVLPVVPAAELDEVVDTVAADLAASSPALLHAFAGALRDPELPDDYAAELDTSLRLLDGPPQP